MERRVHALFASNVGRCSYPDDVLYSLCCCSVNAAVLGCGYPDDVRARYSALLPPAVLSASVDSLTDAFSGMTTGSAGASCSGSVRMTN